MISGENSRRIHGLDVLRGGSISLMVLHHMAYSYRFLFNGKFDLYTPFLGIAILFVCLFFTISGISSHLSRNNYTRSFKTLFAAAVISFVTYLGGPQTFIAFGVIHCLGSCMLIYTIIGKYTDRLFGKITPYVYVFGFILAFFFTRWLNPISVPHLYPLGFYDYSFYSADYYGIFPWIFMFLFGGSIARLVINFRLPGWFYKLRCRPVEWAGSHALLVYIFHQPIAVAILFVLTKIFPQIIN
jgi:uncharacterized membrane protein